MNPFNLPGPWFLLFFSALAAILLAGLFWVRRAWEPDPTIAVVLTDPYEIACLRGGSTEVLRVATTGLIDRGLLEIDGRRLKVVNPSIAQMIRNPTEKAVLEHFWTGNDITSMFARESLRHEGDSYEGVLEQRGLISDKDGRMQQLLTCVAAIGVLWVVAVTKLQVSVDRTYANHILLVLLAVLFSLAALSLALVRKTQRGERFLKDMQSLFYPLLQRAGTFEASANTNELVLMGAVFGLNAVPTATYPYLKQLFPQIQPVAVGGSSCGSGSACGSSCGGGATGCGGCGS